jgi:ceramide glucosyltransferase
LLAENAENPQCDAQLLVCPENLGVNAKVSKLVQMFRQARHGIIIVSDADVRVPPDFLAALVPGFLDDRVGLLNCFYEMAMPVTPAMRWEAVAVNADFWSQVLQSRTLKPLDFALGAVMAVRREALEGIGGFAALANHLADDYHLGNRVSKAGWRIELCTQPVECLDAPAGWAAVWRHQLRWSRTIRICQPVPYFFSILSNPTFWPLLWVAIQPGPFSLAGLIVALALRMILAADLQHRLTLKPRAAWQAWMAPVKDLLQLMLWLAAFAGSSVEWRGVRYKVGRDGRLVKMN